MTDSEILQLLGGVTAVARMLDIKPPSVHGWLDTGIPEGRLRDLAAQIEIRSGGRFSRRQRWPDKYLFYWPELAQVHGGLAPAAIDSVVPEPSSPASPPNFLALDHLTQERRACNLPGVDADGQGV